MELLVFFLMLMGLDPVYTAKLKLKMRMKMRAKAKSTAKIQSGGSADGNYNYNMNDAIATVQYSTLRQTWIRLFIYNPATFNIEKDPLRFFSNKAYLEQEKRRSNRTASDQFGDIYIPDQDYFYLVLLKN